MNELAAERARGEQAKSAVLRLPEKVQGYLDLLDSTQDESKKISGQARPALFHRQTGPRFEPLGALAS